MESQTERLSLQNLISAINVTFKAQLSLEQMASLKIIVIFWNKNSIREQLPFAIYELTDTASSSTMWKAIIRKISEDINDLKVPKIIREQLCEINSYISKSLLYWLIHAYATFLNYSENLEPLTWKSYFFTSLNLFWNALCKSNSYEMKFCDNVESCTTFQRPFLALWYNIPKSLENRIHQNAEMIALVLYFLPWHSGQHVIYHTISKIEDSRKKDVITSKYGRLKCVYFIEHNEWQFYNLYTSSMLPTKDELFNFKKFLIDKEGPKTATYFFKNKAPKNGKEYSHLCYKLENELSDKDYFIKYFTKHRHWESLDIYLNMFCKLNEIYEIKKSLLKKEGYHLIELLIESTGWLAQKKFLKNFFESEVKPEKSNKKFLEKCFLKKFNDDPCEDILLHFLK